MNAINTFLEVCKSINELDTPVTANRKLINAATEFCKNHTHSDQLILVVKVGRLKPLLYSHSYNFSITNLHELVNRRIAAAKKSQKGDIIVLEWLTFKQVAIPYSVLMAPKPIININGGQLF